MDWLRWIWHRIVFAAAVVLCFVPPLAAQDDPVPEDKSSWVLGYALAVLAVILGLTVLCRPGNRSSEVKIDD